MDKASTGHFVWYDHRTLDRDAAIAFYSHVVGWKTQPFAEGGDYVMWLGAQGPLGGVYSLPEEVRALGVAPHWMGNVQVDDVDATVARARALGGKVFQEPSDVPTVGRHAMIGDRQGAALSIFKPLAPMRRHDVAEEGEICWNELFTSDAPDALAFYSELFGWSALETVSLGAMGTYLIFGVGGVRLGGMMTMIDAASQPAWTPYVQVRDLDAALARARAKGARVLMGPHEVKDGGRVAQLDDPQGASFALHQAPIA